MSDMLSLSEGEGKRGFRLKIILLGGAGVFLDGYDLFIVSIALILLKPYFRLGSFELSMVGSAALIGATLGARWCLGILLTSWVGRHSSFWT